MSLLEQIQRILKENEGKPKYLFVPKDIYEWAKKHPSDLK